MKRFLRRPLLALCLAGALAAAAAARPAAQAPDARWVGTWATAPQLTEPGNLPPAPGFADVTVRQVVQVSIGGPRVRVRFSNEFGRGPLTLVAARIARSAGGSTIQPGTDRALTFAGQPHATIPEGAPMVSDPLDFDLPPLSQLAITLRLRGVPAEVTGHPGSRTTSYFQVGDAMTAVDLPEAVRVDRWYFLGGVDVLASDAAAAVAVLGDSITDGRGSTTNGQDRWPDQLARRLQANPATSRVAVLNLGIGGNRLVRDSLGPNALARLDRDVLAAPGVRWLIVLEGINDIGTAVTARAKGEPAATADDVIAAYGQIVARARGRGLRVYGATLLPFGGAVPYDSPQSETDRQRVNTWIRTGGAFDAVIDFDAITRDLASPTRLSAAVDGGDHLHPSAAGYRIMAEAIDLTLFTPVPGARLSARVPRP